jgi:uncharacterized protein (DUF885 family)
MGKVNMKLQLVTCVALTAVLLTGCDSSDKNSESPVSSNPQRVEAESPSAADNQRTAQVSQNNIDELYRNAMATLFMYRPISATLYGLGEAELGQSLDNRLDDYSPATEQALRQKLRHLSQQIAEYPIAEAPASVYDTQQVMANITRYYAGHADFPVGYIDVWMGLSPFIINQINGPLIDTPRTLQTDQNIKNEQDALRYIERLAHFDQFVTSVQNKFDADVKRGWIAPKIVLQGALRYLDNFVKPKPESHPLVVSFAEKLQSLDALSHDKKHALIDEAIQQVTDVVYPAYQAITEHVKATLENARDEHGIWAQPNGDLFYRDAIRQLGDSDLSADQIHQIGLDEVTRITQQMDRILRAQGYNKGTVGERMKALNEEPRFLYEDSDAGRQQLLSDVNGYIAEITEKMSGIFKTKPPYSVEVRAFPVDIQEGAPGGQYTPAAVDGSKPGIYWINLRDMKANPKFGLKTLTYHEANPGHHWQISLNLAQTDMPFLRRIAPYNAYVEGWALYAEQVAQELGMYQQDPFGDLGRLQAELFRAVRLVVDTGLHHKRWTREQAIDYMAKTTGSAQSDVVSEIERYMTWPGQALGYKMGMITLLKLRQQAQTELGESFDIAEFHDLILLGGAVPMTVLEQKVSRWIAEKKQNRSKS